MKKLAKMLAVVLSLVLVMGVVTACGGNDEPAPDENVPTDTTPVDGEEDSTPVDGEEDSTPVDGEEDSTPVDGEEDAPVDGEEDAQ